eukprot:518465_1
MKCIYVIILFIYATSTSISLEYDQWTEITTPSLPRATYGAVVGYEPLNKTIWILGGHPTRSQLVSFSITDTAFTDYGSNYLWVSGFSQSIRAISQEYAQMGTKVYFIDVFQTNLYVFDTQTLSITSPFPSPRYDFTMYGACVTTFRDDYVAVLGSDGGTGRKAQILQISSNTWLNLVPTLRVSRYGAACACVNDRLFIIGGSDEPPLDSIEYIGVSSTNIATWYGTVTYWLNNPYTLPEGIGNSRAIVYNHFIMVIGGNTDINYKFTVRDTIYLINGNTGYVSLGGHLALAVMSPGVVFIDNIIFSFGGRHNSSAQWDGWQMKSVIPTSAPTSAPTASPTDVPSQPTVNPTRNPTQYPTIFTLGPTNHPTKIPTNDPTFLPSHNPTTNPTFHPTVYPTAIPSIYPTKYPTADPTAYPTTNPTKYPTSSSHNPTTSPTIYPSIYPSIYPTINPTANPTAYPTKYPTAYPTINPTTNPTSYPTAYPTANPTIYPTINPTTNPTAYPTAYPTASPTIYPSIYPTTDPTT